uniref:Uncharacterized protein n=1 Tax=Vespula pensylvanica TaxID=30213 RepID=A0A834K493_VESPE|nr:hypothetical protein H0235_015599 [Vespula pensylvanica]
MWSYNETDDDDDDDDDDDVVVVAKKEGKKKGDVTGGRNRGKRHIRRLVSDFDVASLTFIKQFLSSYRALMAMGTHEVGVGPGPGSANEGPGIRGRASSRPANRRAPTAWGY